MTSMRKCAGRVGLGKYSSKGTAVYCCFVYYCGRLSSSVNLSVWQAVPLTENGPHEEMKGKRVLVNEGMRKRL